MPLSDPSPSQPPRPPRHFDTTKWTLVQQASSDDPATADAALEMLCKAYWFPVYAYIRSRDRSEADAKDLTQGFFERFLRHRSFAKVAPGQGRLRSYLLRSVKNYLASERARGLAEKRGGEAATISLDSAWAEGALAGEPMDDLTPDRIYQRTWAVTVLDFAFQLLEEEFASDGRSEEYGQLRPMLGFTSVPERSYAELAERTGWEVSVLKMRVYRMRKRWKELVRRQVALTLGDASDGRIKDELAELLEMM